MYLWRNLPQGQLTAVLQWMRDRRPAPTGTPRAPEQPPEAVPLPGDNGARDGEARR